MITEIERKNRRSRLAKEFAEHARGCARCIAVVIAAAALRQRRNAESDALLCQEGRDLAALDHQEFVQ